MPILLVHFRSMFLGLATITLFSVLIQMPNPHSVGMPARSGQSNKSVYQQKKNNHGLPVQTSQTGVAQAAPDEYEQKVKVTSLPSVRLEDRKKTSWDYLYEWGPWAFNLLLAVVGILQVWLLTITWRAVSKQTQLQEFNARQWVDLGDWDVTSERDLNDYSGRLKDSISVQLSFRIFDNTPLPLTLNRVACAISKTVTNPQWENFETAAENVIAPHSDTSENYYPYFLSLPLRGDEIYRYSRTALAIHVNIRVFFLNAQRIATPQHFTRFVLCGPKSFKVENSVGQELEMQDNDGQAPE